MYTKTVTVEFCFESEDPFELDDKALVEHLESMLESDVVDSQLDLLISGAQTDGLSFYVVPEVHSAEE